MSRPATERRADLVALYKEASGCVRCPLAEGRTNVVFGAGSADANLMFVGEAPGAEEDRQGLPFVGRAGKLLTELLGGIGLQRGDVFIANVLKCLRYNARVQLGDGSWERIGRLVRSRYPGDVMSVDENGTLVRRRVIGWHATPVADRSVYRLTYRSAKHAGAGRVGVQLTGDHPVLTRRGYVRVDQLRADDEIATGQGLSAGARDVVCGTLLGDGTMRANSGSSLAFAHSERQRDYALFKMNLLAELEPRAQQFEVAAVAGGERRYETVHVRTLAHRALRMLKTQFYGERKVVPEWMASDLNPRMLAIWFMDDGYMRIRPPRRPSALISTESFDDDGRQHLLDGLARLDLRAGMNRKGELVLGVEATAKLARLIAPYVPDSMRWKLTPEAAAEIPFDPTCWARGPATVMYAQVEIEDVTHAYRADTTFFCIDVAETHNFVTAGGVVHNCRPPGNRDPQPEEIESCSPYLERQIELIEPRVIATLGNFATKRLTRNQAGITRVRGTPQVHELGGRTVFVMPLFHPAAALRTPAMLETLREDFAKLPVLLAQEPPSAAAEQVATQGAHGLESVAAAAPERAPDQLDLFA